jgi:hypothetical protein
MTRSIVSIPGTLLFALLPQLGRTQTHDQLQSTRTYLPPPPLTVKSILNLPFAQVHPSRAKLRLVALP